VFSFFNDLLIKIQIIRKLTHPFVAFALPAVAWCRLVVFQAAENENIIIISFNNPLHLEHI
jgi:hypothetical protein